MTDFDPVLADTIRARVREVQDFPKPGIGFKDLTPVLEHGPTLRALIDALEARYAPRAVDGIVAIESRGFLLGAPLAAALGVGLILVRKPGKLPRATRRQAYALEYGTDVLEIHADATRPGQRLVVVDDVLATGGTMAATIALVRSGGAEVVEAAFALELAFLGGRAKLDAPAASVVIYR